MCPNIKTCEFCKVTPSDMNFDLTSRISEVFSYRLILKYNFKIK